MKSLPAWVPYTALRILLFAAPFAVLMIAGVPWWISALVAAVFGFAASVVLLRGYRERLATDLYEARHREKPEPTVDAEVEDAVIDAKDARERPAE
ncbi:DUF4229 domain-containing protein [Agromyces protaetiae]|uniref:DUF4229 domain-containing protein n=1 Tax=Agromyces protaetiae TaxID=2509455 RepID=UPI0013ED7B1A|nr:DUF4229 domain-containing protein [Agromyces protaetiae]